MAFKVLNELSSELSSVLTRILKAVWTLEMKRRENDQKIVALHVEMRNMMTVLVECVDLHASDDDVSNDQIGSKESTIRHRWVWLEVVYRNLQILLRMTSRSVQMFVMRTLKGN